ncbi:MAG TPA: C4-type zinc ribbon domain-containing protein [Saprospiraceae bacterium]|jgi:predicted  nucleic acid-binding Zn-ribbon protein|nr:C4-type zinc ribbon domain-containing protein [Saprospiraceae bacterium]
MAAVKEQSIADKLRALHALQQIDSKMDEIGILKGELPIEVSDLEDEITGLKTRSKKLETNVADVEHEINQHNANIKESEGLIVKYEKQLDNVKNNREFDALTKEIELQKLEIQLSQKKIREATITRDTKKEALDTILAKLGSRSKDADNKKVELSKIIEKTEKEEAKLLKESDKARKEIDERLLTSYDKIRKTYRNGLAVVTVARGACGGCFNRIPPQLIIEIGVMKKIIACEHCGRVLIDEAILEGHEA